MIRDYEYRFLNLEGGRWPLAESQGVEIDAAGALVLSLLPAAGEPLGPEFDPTPALEGPAGVGVAPDGTVYVADPARHRILRLPPCSVSAEPLPCLRGPGANPGELDRPRGVLVGPRSTLYVADAGNARIQLFDLVSGQLRGIWGGRGSTLFAEPWDLTADRCGHVYVADAGRLDALGRRRAGRVLRLDLEGRVDRGFSENYEAEPNRPESPAAVTLLAGSSGQDDHLLVLQHEPPSLFAFTLDGRLESTLTSRWQAATRWLTSPVALAAGGGRLYVADPVAGLLAFSGEGAFLGRTMGGVAGVGLDCGGSLYLHPGGGGPLRLARPGVPACGTFLLGPLRGGRDDQRWQLVELDAEGLGPDSQLRLFTLTSQLLDGTAGNSPVHPAPCGGVGPAVVPPSDPGITPLDQWRAAPWNATDLRVHGEPARFLWIAGQYAASSTASPRVRQVRVTWNGTGWLANLPALFSREGGTRLVLQRYLGLHQLAHERTLRTIEALPRLADPGAAPDHAPDQRWLDWLATWVDAPLDATWTEAERRRTVRGAFQDHALRGTRSHMVRALRHHAHVHASVEELGLMGVPWALGVTGALGIDSTLPLAAGGAVLDTRATLDQSPVLPASRDGEALRSDVAHRFRVMVWAAELPGPEAIERVRGVVEREKPAHTEFELCILAGGMRVGAVARVGLETVVAEDLRAADGSAGLGGGVRVGIHSSLV